MSGEPQTIGDVIYQCRKGFIPVNLPVELAIEAHLQSVNPWLDQQASFNVLRAVILAAATTPAEARLQIDYLDGLPDIAWPTGPGEWEKRRDAIEGLRRSLAWQTVHA